MKLKRGIAGILSAGALAVLPVAVQAQAPVVVCTSVADLVPCPSFGSQPSQIYLGSDGRTVLLGLRWTHWGHTTATGHGVLRENAGPPGKPEYIRSRADVTLSNLRECDSHRAYTHIHWRARDVDIEYHGCVPHA